MNNFASILLLATGILIGYVNAESCIVCDSDNDVNCVQDPALLMPRDCRTTNPAGCYTRIVGVRTLRGCVDEMDDSVANSCRNSASCEICQSLGGQPGCNSNVYPAHRPLCHQCKGDLNSNCSIENTNPKACRNYFEIDRCFIRKTKDTIERGCTSNTTQCADGHTCFLCDGQGCNYLNANSSDIPLDTGAASIAVPSILVSVLALIVALLR